ncbi:AMP-binding protein, partial [Lysinibacillus sp. NPDC092081]|uniref:non-ribosomal peptide synthetase n=1 Tax=Lysinibacillus sp. NPDC092081 TaxID=3364131 RepID=UPI003820EBE6
AVPALFDAMLEGITAEEWSCVRIVTLAGDRVTEKTLQVVENTCPHIEIINEYGPTEGSVVATFKRDMTAETVGNIGRAIPGTQVYIMNEHLQILPAGVPGEIIIGGRGLAQQYLNRPQLTEEKFVNHPNIAIGRIYRTGDKGVWQENGEIHFLGRMDNQVKIRGYRVELGEIERAFEKISGVNEVAALILDENNKMLVLSYTGDAKLTEAYMRHFATQHLPNYMIPSAFYHLGTLPYTKTGKLDREQLKHVINQIASSTEHNDQHTMSETEEKLTIIWAEKLNHQFFNRHDHFFEIGGNSIKLMQVQTAIKQIFDKEISVADLFAHPTISQLATFIEQGIPEVIVENLEIEIEIEMEEQLTDIIEALDRGDLSFEHALKSLEKLEDDYDK